MSTGPRQTTLVIDGHSLFRNDVSQLFVTDKVFESSGEATFGTRGYQPAVSMQPNMGPPSLRVKDMNGVETLKAINAADLDSRVIALKKCDSEKMWRASYVPEPNAICSMTRAEDPLANHEYGSPGTLVLVD